MTLPLYGFCDTIKYKRISPVLVKNKRKYVALQNANFSRKLSLEASSKKRLKAELLAYFYYQPLTAKFVSSNR